MKFLLSKILSVIGPSQLLKLVWSVVKDDLEKLAKSTDSKIDDNLIIVIDEFIKEL